MSFDIQVTFKEGGEWEQITSSASHMMETLGTGFVTYTDDAGIACKKKVFAMKLPNGDIYDFVLHKWRQRPRSSHFL
jgi:hypothetical protein